ncbi:hypothetical protein [Catellatospora paridis]|uniref:hypothetical protein n=1 Tax=Catellatospora paridis TaxID=1617086 RepID=UPI0012D3F368|nr:hypothetical protein [Catellatospora paridis]
MDPLLLFGIIVVALFVLFRIRPGGGGRLTDLGDAFWIAIPIALLLLCLLGAGLL